MLNRKLSVVCYLTRLQVDSELNTLLMRLPNLLDSRVPDGDGEEENVVVAEWGQEYIKSGEVTCSGIVNFADLYWEVLVSGQEVLSADSLASTSFHI